MRNGSDFVFESVDLLSYHIHKINLRRGRSYIKSPEWVLNKRATINPKNIDNNKCFQYSITVALNHQNHPERTSNIKPFINQYNWEGIDFPAGIKNWKKFEKNNETIALNILQVYFTCQNNPNKSYTEQKAIYEPCGYSLDLVCSFDSEEDKHSFYRGNDCIKKFCSELKDLGTKAVNYEQREMTPLTADENKYYEEQKKCYICGKAFCYDKIKKRDLNYTKMLEIIAISLGNLQELLIAFVI